MNCPCFAPLLVCWIPFPHASLRTFFSTGSFPSACARAIISCNLKMNWPSPEPTWSISSHPLLCFPLEKHLGPAIHVWCLLLPSRALWCPLPSGSSLSTPPKPLTLLSLPARGHCHHSCLWDVSSLFEDQPRLCVRVLCCQGTLLGLHLPNVGT